MHHILRAVVAPSLLACSCGWLIGCSQTPAPQAAAHPATTARSSQTAATLTSQSVLSPARAPEPPASQITGVRQLNPYVDRTTLVRQPTAKPPAMAPSYRDARWHDDRTILQLASHPQTDSSLDFPPSPVSDLPLTPAGAPPATELALPASDRPFTPSPAPPVAASEPIAPVVPTADHAPQPIPVAIDPAALRGVSRQAEQRVDEAFALARRGAVYAARAELIQSLRMISQAVDTLEGGNQRSHALAAALQAMKEAEDFCTDSVSLEHDLNVRETVLAHRTPVLKDKADERTTSLTALQHYYAYAQQQLAIAAAGTPAGSRALYGLGKAHLSLARESTDGRANHAPKAMALFQASLQADGRNHLAANELGVLLAKYGQWNEAKRALVQSVSTQSHAEGWHNLAVVHEQLGEHELAALAHKEREHLLARQPQQMPAAAGKPPVEWVSPQQFAASGKDAELAAAPLLGSQPPTRSASAGNRRAPSPSFQQR